MDHSSGSETSFSLILESPNVNSENLETSVDESTPKSSKIKTSWVNEHFTEYTEGFQCKYCPEDKRKIFPKSKNGSTGNRIKHLKNVHSDYIQTPGASPKIYSAKEFESLLCEFIISANLSFSVVENPKFQELLFLLNSLAKLPCRQTVKSIISKKFQIEKQKVELSLQQAPGKFTVFIDGWSSRNGISFQGVILEYLDKDFTRKKFALDLTMLLSLHTGENLAEELIKVLQDYKILNRILCISTDNASNCDTLIQHFGNRLNNEFEIEYNTKNRIRCISHILNLSCKESLKHLNYKHSKYSEIPQDTSTDILVQDVIDVIESNEEYDRNFDLHAELPDFNSEDILKKLRFGIIKIRSSTQRLRKFKELCLEINIKPINLKLDVKTRWNSSYLMIERAIRLRNVYDSMISSDTKLSAYTLLNTEWEKLVQIKILLEPFYDLTNCMSWENQTVSFVGVSFIHLFSHLDKYIKQVTNPENGQIFPYWLRASAESAKSKLEEYWSIIDDDIYIIGIVLDPRMKYEWFKNVKLGSKAIKTYKAQVEKVWKAYKLLEIRSESETEPEPKKFKSIYSSQMKNNHLNRDELANYLSMPLLNDDDLDGGILTWWKANQHYFPNLAKMARDYLGPTGSNVSVERFFSLGTDLITPKRASLNSNSITQCMLLKSWIHENDK